LEKNGVSAFISVSDNITLFYISFGSRPTYGLENYDFFSLNKAKFKREPRVSRVFPVGMPLRIIFKV
jgi:hypothetical protein